MNIKKLAVAILYVIFISSCSGSQDEQTKSAEHKVVLTDKAPQPIGPYSQAILVGNTIYCAGQIGADPVSRKLVEGIEGQTQQAMKNLGAVLEAGGYTYADAVNCTIYLTDLKNYGTVNKIYGSFFTEAAPARATVQVDSLPGNALIEIALIAARQ